MGNITFSFIIPHKNCPDLLERCVRSIPDREDIQIIVVDDNSDSDKRPMVVRDGLEVVLIDALQSKGAGRARNIGLDHAKGEWLLFADADDFFTDYLPVLLEKYHDDEVTDIVYLSASKFNENALFTKRQEAETVDDFLNSRPKAEMKLRYSIWTPWSRMVKRRVVVDNGIRFDEIPAGNDKMFGLLCSRYSNTISAEKEIVYNYFRPTYNSQTDNNRNNLMFNDMVDLQRRTVLLYREVGYKPLPSFFKFFFYSKYSKGLSYKYLIPNYLKSLRKSRVSIFSDIFCFIYENIAVRVRRNKKITI